MMGPETIRRGVSRVVLRTAKGVGVGAAAGFVILLVLFILLAPDRRVTGVFSADLWVWGVMIGVVYGATAGGLLGLAVGFVYALLLEVDSQT